MQVKYNAVYAYEVLGCRRLEFVKDWNKTTDVCTPVNTLRLDTVERHSLYTMQKESTPLAVHILPKPAVVARSTTELP